MYCGAEGVGSLVFQKSCCVWEFTLSGSGKQHFGRVECCTSVWSLWCEASENLFSMHVRPVWVTWIYVLLHTCPAGWPSCMAKPLTLSITQKLFKYHGLLSVYNVFLLALTVAQGHIAQIKTYWPVVWNSLQLTTMKSCITCCAPISFLIHMNNMRICERKGKKFQQIWVEYGTALRLLQLMNLTLVLFCPINIQGRDSY